MKSKYIINEGSLEMKDVLFLCQYFYPEYNSSATLPFDTAVYLARHGKSVDVLCGYPKEYTDEAGVPKKEEKDDVHIRRIHYLQLSRGGKIGRLINYFSFTLSALMRVFSLRKYRTVIVYSNPPILPLVTIIANALFKTEFVFVAYDIYPEVAYASRSVRHGDMIDRVMKQLNHQLYKRATKIVALTDEMKCFILSHRLETSEEKVCVIPNWAHERKTTTTNDSNLEFNDLEDKFVVAYFGNMGICQDIETMLTAIRLLENNPRIHFLIAGHGSKKAKFEEQVKDLHNVTVTDFLTGTAFECAVAITSCCIVSLEPGLMGTCAPSKYYSYLQGGCPVVAITEDGSYLAQELQQENIGIHVCNGDGEGLAGAIKMLMNDQQICVEMGRNAERLYKKKYDQPVALKKYDDAISSILRTESSSVSV